MDNNLQNGDWVMIPDSMRKPEGTKRDHAIFEDLDQGRIPTPLPIRVKSGSAGKASLTLNTANKSITINWNDVELLALGIIRTEVGKSEATKSRVRKFVRQILLGDTETVEKTKYQSDIYLLDIYVRGNESPFRIDQATVNYKSFLVSPGYASLQNFRNLVKRIIYFAENTRLDSCLIAFVSSLKEKLIFYNSVYDFELESQIRRSQLHNLIPRAEIHVEIDET